MQKLHSFGGSALDRHVFDFETAIDATEMDVATTLETAPAGEPAPDTATPAPPVEAGLPSPEPETPAGTTPIDWDSPEVAAQIEQRTQAAIERMVAQAQAEQAAVQNAPQAPGIPDPFSDNYAAEMEAYLAYQVEQRMSSVQPVVEQMQAQQAQAWTDHQLETLGVPTESPEEIGDNGVTSRDAVLYYAGGIEAAAQAAGVQVDGAAIMAHAWQQLQSRDTRIGEQAVAKYKAELEGVANAPTDAAGTTGATPGLIDAEDELALARLLGERRNAA